LVPWALIILDDLPETTGIHSFDTRLLLLNEVCSREGWTLMTTSHEELPLQTRERAGVSLVNQKIPLFDNQQAKELLLAHGAPARLLNEKFVSFLQALARNHPMVLTAIARYLASARWRISSEVIDGLFRGDYAEDLKPYTQRLLKATIADPKSRELLYRLNLAGYSFTKEDVKRVSEVDPEIDLPMERLDDALGLWVQRDSGSRFLISPLLTSLGSTNLPSATGRHVHRVLGLGIMAKGKLGPPDVMTAFSHFHSAGDYDRAATTLIVALNALTRLQGTVPDDWQITSIWADCPLPEEIDLTLRLHLRSLQVIARRQLGKDVHYVLDDFDSLFARAGQNDGFGVVAGAVGLAVDLGGEEPTRINRYLLKAIMALPSLALPDGTAIKMPDQSRFEYLFWRTALGVKSEEELQNWISTVEQLVILG